MFLLCVSVCGFVCFPLLKYQFLTAGTQRQQFHRFCFVHCCIPSSCIQCVLNECLMNEGHVGAVRGIHWTSLSCPRYAYALCRTYGHVPHRPDPGHREFAALQERRLTLHRPQRKQDVLQSMPAGYSECVRNGRAGQASLRKGHLG